MTRPQPFTVVFFGLLLFLLYQIGLILQPFVFPALWAALLVHATYPLHERLTRLCGGRDTLSASMLTIGVLAVVVVPLIIVGILLVRETRDAEKAIRSWIAEGGWIACPSRSRPCR